MPPEPPHAIAPPSVTPQPAAGEASAPALRNGGRREVQVLPEHVWQPEPPPPPAPWAKRSFFAPIASVVALSAALLYGLLAVLGLLWRWLS